MVDNSSRFFDALHALFFGRTDENPRRRSLRWKNKTKMASSGGSESKDIIICINCRQQIQHRLHVKCCECPAIICVDCFSCGCEAGRHFRGHNYEIRDPLGGRIFDAKGSWGAIEERKLLEAAYRFKLGNWGEVTRMMETNRPVSQVKEYYDRFFIRGPIGQLALKLLNWEETKRTMIADGSLRYQCEVDRITYMLLVVDALKESKERLDPKDDNLTTVVEKIVRDYVNRLDVDTRQQPQCGKECEPSEINDVVLTDDSCDPSDGEMDRNKPPEDAYSTGLEPENDSDEDDSNTMSLSRAVKVVKCGTRSTTNKSVREFLGPSVAIMRVNKKGIRCGLRKAALEKNGKTSRYRRVQAYSSSTDDDCGSGEDGENVEADQASMEEVQDSMHGLEREDTTDEYTASDSEEPKSEFVQPSPNTTGSVRRRKRARLASKKARRLKEIQKRMTRMTKVAERRLSELAELCPTEKVQELRASKPELALYSNDYSARPKEWCNEAENLISRMMIEESSDRVEEFENDIKFARIEKYNRILKIRKAYRRAIVEHDKIPEFFKFMMNMTMEKRKASQIISQRTALEKLTVRAQQCLTKKELEDLRGHIERSSELVERIAKLQELQRSGICSLKEAVFLVNVLCWTRILMDSLASLLFISTMIEVYFLFAFSSLLFLKRKLRCYGLRNIHLKMKHIPCSLEGKMQNDLYVEEVVVDGPQDSSLLKLVFHKPGSRRHRALKSFKLRESVFTHNTGDPAEASQGSTTSTSSSTHDGNYPVIVEAVLSANTVEDIADTHPDFARLLIDCYSAGCDLEEYKREFQRLKNLRIKRQGGVNQTLSFSLFPSVPSDLPSHLFVRLLKFHSLYEGACRKYITDVVNRRAEAPAGFPFNLAKVGIHDLIQEDVTSEYFAPTTSNQSVVGPYQEQDFEFAQPFITSQMGMTGEVNYSPAFNNSTLARASVATSSNVGAHLSNNEASCTPNMQRTTSMHPYTQGDGLTLPEGTIPAISFVERRLAATPLPSWSQQEPILSGPRSQMATPLPPLEIRQCPILRSELTRDTRVESQTMQTPVHYMQQTRQFSTPAPQMETRQSYSIAPRMQGTQYHAVPTSGMHGNVCEDSQRVMTVTPMHGDVDTSLQNQVTPFATPTKKPRTRRKASMAPSANQAQPQQSMTLQSRQMTATPIPEWHEHQANKSVRGVQAQATHVQNKDVLTSSVTTMQQQLATSARDHREIIDSNAIPMPAWMPQQVTSSNAQSEGGPLMPSLPPLSQFTAPQPQQGQVKIPYPSMPNRQLVTIHHGQPGNLATAHHYEQSSHVYSQSREMVTPVPFAQGGLVNVTYGQHQELSSQMGSSAAEMYQSQGVPYQWPTVASANVYREQPQFVQQSPYGQQSQFDQRMIAGNQSHDAFVGNQSAQYPTQGVHSQQAQYLQTAEIQKVSAFSQPFSYMQQSYPVSTIFQQQSPYSQGSNFPHTCSQRSPCTRQQADQEQQQHYHQQHMQQQHIQQQIYENPAQYGDQYSHMVSSYSAQSACGVQATQHVGIQGHQMSRSCEVANVGVLQHAPEISSNKQQETPSFSSGLMDMNGSSSSGVIIDMLQNHEALTSSEALEANLDQHATRYSDMVSSSMSGAVLVEPLMDGELRTFDITQCPPPPRNDSEATVPARISPNSCSPGMMVVDDESSSLIPTFFYPKDFSQNDLSEIDIQGSPVEKGLNCQHFRFDIILAMKHHRIEKEDYERTLFELDQMEKEKCAGPLGDLLMKRLGLKRQVQQSYGEKFSVDELVAAFAANAKIRESNAKLSGRRESSELFSEFLEDINPVPSNASANFVVKRDSILNQQAPGSSTLRSDALHSVDAAADLGYLLSDDVISEFNSLSPTTLSAQKSLLVAAPEPLFNIEQPSMCTSPRLKAPSCDEAAIFADMSYEFNSGLISEKSLTETAFLANDSNAVFSVSSIGASFSCGQPAAPAKNHSSPATDLSGQSNVSVSRTSTLPSSGFCGTTALSSVCASPKLKSITELMVSTKSSPECDQVSRKTLSFGAPAQPARRLDAFSSDSFGKVSPLVISPEPLSDEAEWWRRDDPTPPMLSGLNQVIPETSEPLPMVQQSPGNSKSCTSHEGDIVDNIAIGSGGKDDGGGDKHDDGNDDDDIDNDAGDVSSINVVAAEGDNSDNGDDDAENDISHDGNRMDSFETFDLSKHCAKVDSDTSVSAKQLCSPIRKNSEKDLETPDSPLPQRSVYPKNSSVEAFQRISSKSTSEHVKKPVKKTNKSLFVSDSSDETSREGGSTLSRSHHSASYPDVSVVVSKKSRSPSTHHATFRRCVKKKKKKSPMALKASKETPRKSVLSKVELSRERLAKQIAEIIEEERSKLSPEESRLPRRQLSPATLNIVIQDLMQHHISEDTSPNRDLFASKLLGKDVFSKLFCRAGKCVFRHYEELDEFRRKEKGKGRRRGGTSRKRDTELLRGIRKSREIQKYRDAVRAAKEPSEAEKAAAAEKAKLEAMPWLARSTFKPDVQQGSSTRFVIPKKSNTSTSDPQKSGCSSGSTTESKRGSVISHNASDMKIGHQRLQEGVIGHKASTNEKGLKKVRLPPFYAAQKSCARLHHRESILKLSAEANVRKIEEISISSSFFGTPKFSLCRARVKYTWPLKRCRSTSAVIEEPFEMNLDRIMEEETMEEFAHSAISFGLEMNSFSGVNFREPSPTVLVLEALPTTSCISERESPLAALALQEELSRSEMASPDDQFDGLSYLAAMPESEFFIKGENSASVSSVCLQNVILKPSQQPADETEVRPASNTSEENRVDDQFEQMDWMRTDHGFQTFFSSDFDVEPWHLSPSSVSLTHKYLPQNVQVATTASNVASLYSSLQEELDSIVRDTLGEALCSPGPMEHILPTALALERFDWPKADVSFRSYALDIVLPKLSCDKARIPILDLCCCERCLTRCVYYCDDDEWKYLYDCAVSRRKEVDSGQLASQPLSSLPHQVCSTDYSLRRKSESGCISFTWYEHAFLFQNYSFSLVRTFPKFSEFIRRPVYEVARVCWPVYHRTLETDEFTRVFAEEDSCNLERQASVKNAHIVWAQFQSTYDQDSISTLLSPKHVVLEGESCAAKAEIVQPIYQKVLTKSSMIISSVMNMNLHSIGPSIECLVCIPVPKTEVFCMNIVEAQLLYVRDDSVLTTKAIINIPRTSVASLSICSSTAVFGTPRWILDNSNCYTKIALPRALLDTKTLSVCHFNVGMEWPNSFSSTVCALPIHRLDSTSLSCHYQSETLLRTDHSFNTEITLALPVFDFIFYQYCNIRVRRKREAVSACTLLTLPVCDLEASFLSASDVKIERKGREFGAVAEISVPQPREELSFLNVYELNVQRCHQGFADRVTGVLPLPQREYTMLTFLKLNVKRKKVGFSGATQTLVYIPRAGFSVLSITRTDIHHRRETNIGTSNRVISISRDDTVVLKSFEMNIKRRRRPVLCHTNYYAAVPRQDSATLNSYHLPVRFCRLDDRNHLEYICPIPRVYKTVYSVIEQDFDFISQEFSIFDTCQSIDTSAEESTLAHILIVNVHRRRKEQSLSIRHVEHYSEMDSYKLTVLRREESFSKHLNSDCVRKNSKIILSTPRKSLEILRLSTVRMSRKRRYEEEAFMFVKRLALEDRADLFLTEKNFYANSNRTTEVVFIKDPRHPVKCENSFMELSMGWRNFAHRHMPHLVFSSYMVTQFALLLQRVFASAVDRCTISMKELSCFISNSDGRYNLDIFTNPERVLISGPVSSGLIWDRLMKLRLQRNSSELLNRKSLAHLYIFLGKPNLPRIGRPWRRWLKPLEIISDSRIGCQLALCMRVPDLIGVDDMDAKVQAIKMWWTFMMLRGTVPWFLYPCFSRRQLFVLVRLLEALENVERPPFCLYPPKLFFKAVKKILSHPRMDLIPKDVYHPDITTMATLLKMKRNRVFHVDRSLPELLSHWMDDMNKIDAYLADDVTISAMCPSKFLTQSEWAWKNYNQGCVPEWIEYNRSISVEKTIDKLTECLVDDSLPLEQRKRISVLRTALGAWSKYDNGPSIDQIPVDIINPFALSPSLIAMLPMPKEFVDECFSFLEKVSKKSGRLCQNPIKRSIRSSPSWNWRPSERLAYAGKPTNAGIKASGRTTISTIFEEFWKCPQDFSSISNFNKKESMTHEPRLIKKSTVKVKDRHSTLSGGKVSHSQRCRRLRKRKDVVVDESSSIFDSPRPLKKSKFETRKRGLVRISDEEGPPSAKHSMKKIPEHRQVRIRHTLARRGAETEKMIHETVSRACAILAAQGSDAPLLPRSTKRRSGTEFRDSDSRTGIAVSSHPSKPLVVKKSRPATIFDVTNFEWVLEMSLRRPRAFVGLYKTMKYQHRILEKRRWVEKNRKLYDKVQFTKFLHESSHSEVDMLEKTRLLKAEKDMERVLGVSRLEAEKAVKFAIKDLAYWYGMNSRYAVEAEVLASQALEKARRFDMAVELLKNEEAKKEGEGLESFSGNAIEKIVSATLNSVIQNIEAVANQEMEQCERELLAVESTLMDMIEQIVEGAYRLEELSMNEIIETVVPSFSKCNSVASNGMMLTSTCGSSHEECDDRKYYEIGQDNIGNSIINLKSKEQQSLKFINNPAQPLFHKQSRLPLSFAYISMVINAGVVLNLHIPFQPRFKRPRRADNDIDLLPPGDFSPYSTDEEWEDYYEKKDRFENHPLQPQLSWSSFRVDDCDGDDDDRASELARLRSCSCGVANERTMQWVAKLPTTSTRKCYSEELLPVDNLCISPSLHQIPVRWNSALSCISLERLPILQPATSTVKAKAVVKCRRQFSFQHDAKLLPSLRQRSISLSPSWKPEVFSLSQKDGRESLCESRRDRLMYRRALSFCRFRVYNTTKLLTPRQRQRPKTGERLILSRIRREKDLPQQWIRRSSPHRQDYIRMVRYRLEVQGQRSIPVLWRSRPDRCESPTSWADRDGDNETQIIQDTPILEPRECQLECPIAVYNPPPTWNSMMRSQSEKRTDVGRSLRNSSSEPSAFQRVLARPQPIDISRLDVELETDEDSNDMVPQWPLLKKLRGMERELLAAGNPVAVERQKIREYNRQIRNEVHEQDGLGEQMRQLQQLYLEQQSIIENMEQQQELDQRWYSLLREEQQLTRRRTRDAVLTDMLFLRPEPYQAAYHSFFGCDRFFLSNILGVQNDDSSRCYEFGNTTVVAPDFSQILGQSENRIPDEEEMSIEVIDVEPEDNDGGIMAGVIPFEDSKHGAHLMHNSSGAVEKNTSITFGMNADPNIDTERESTVSDTSVRQVSTSTTSSPIILIKSPDNRTALSPVLDRRERPDGDDRSTSPEL